MRLEFDVQGIPAPKGSTRSFRNKKTGGTVTTGDNPNTKPWQLAVGWCAKDAMCGAPLMGGPVSVGVVFRMPRPKGHYRKDLSLRPSAPAHHTVKPDLDKLLRAVFDALKHVAWLDDSQVVSLGRCEKRYVSDESAGARVVVEPVGAVPAGGAT